MSYTITDPKIQKRKDSLLKYHQFDIGEPLTDTRNLGAGVKVQGFYLGHMLSFPELDEAWFTLEAENSFVPAQ